MVRKETLSIWVHQSEFPQYALTSSISEGKKSVVIRPHRTIAAPDPIPRPDRSRQCRSVGRHPVRPRGALARPDQRRRPGSRWSSPVGAANVSGCRTAPSGMDRADGGGRFRRRSAHGAVRRRLARQRERPRRVDPRRLEVHLDPLGRGRQRRLAADHSADHHRYAGERLVHERGHYHVAVKNPESEIIEQLGCASTTTRPTLSNGSIARRQPEPWMVLRFGIARPSACRFLT